MSYKSGQNIKQIVFDRFFAKKAVSIWDRQVLAKKESNKM